MADAQSPQEVARLLDCAAALCARHGRRLTPLRRSVLQLVLQTAQPVGAYDLLARLGDGRKRAAPPTIYRALEFLVSAGLIHKVQRLAAFVACTHHLHHDHTHAGHTAHFLICTRCGRAEELQNAKVATALRTAAAQAGFQVTATTIEAEGICADCDTALSDVL